jgi:hypothetical protein
LIADQRHYHYQEFIRLSDDPAEAKRREWLATAKRKYYVKMKTQFNDRGGGRAAG